MAGITPASDLAGLFTQADAQWSALKTELNRTSATISQTGWYDIIGNGTTTGKLEQEYNAISDAIGDLQHCPWYTSPGS